MMKRCFAVLLVVSLACCTLPALAWTTVCEPELVVPLAEGELSPEQVLELVAEQVRTEGQQPEGWTAAGMFHEANANYFSSGAGWYVYLTWPLEDPAGLVWLLNVDGMTGEVVYSSGRKGESVLGTELEGHRFDVAQGRAIEEKGPIALWSLAEKKAFFDAWPVSGCHYDVLGEGDVTEEAALLKARQALQQAGVDRQELAGRIPIYWCTVKSDGGRYLSIELLDEEKDDSYYVLLALPEGRVLTVEAAPGKG